MYTIFYYILVILSLFIHIFQILHILIMYRTKKHQYFYHICTCYELNNIWRIFILDFLGNSHLFFLLSS